VILGAASTTASPTPPRPGPAAPGRDTGVATRRTALTVVAVTVVVSRRIHRRDRVDGGFVERGMERVALSVGVTYGVPFAEAEVTTVADVTGVIKVYAATSGRGTVCRWTKPDQKNVRSRTSSATG
jgi:hypothetical protein